MYSFLILFLLFTTNVNLWDGNHRQIDDELPAISWKDCGISVRNCDSNSTFKNPFVSSRIWGGEYATTGEYPWFAAQIRTYTEYNEEREALTYGRCGAAIINEWWLITVAHCVKNIGANLSVVVKVGSVAIDAGRRHTVETVILHPKYLSGEQSRSKMSRKDSLRKDIINWEVNDREWNRVELEKLFREYIKLRDDGIYKTNVRGIYDIALMKVKNRIILIRNTTHYQINSICLPKSQIINERNESLVIIGMGTTGPSDAVSRRLKKGITLMYTSNKCKESNENYTQVICVQRIHTSNNSLFNSSSCLGDSGSPQHQYYGCQALQLGIEAFSTRSEGSCGYEEWLPRVSSYIPWIRSEILSDRIATELKNTPKTKQLRSSVSGVVSDNPKRSAFKTNHLLIVSVITTAIIAVVVCSALLWISVTILMTRIRLN